jgi:molybdopterin synthase sulfur carrier subunit
MRKAGLPCDKHLLTVYPPSVIDHENEQTAEIMTTTVRIPSSLRKFTGGQEVVAAQGRTVAEVIDDLERQHQGLRDCLLDSAGIRRFVNLYIGENDIRFLKGLDTEIGAGDSLTILPGIAGG